MTDSGDVCRSDSLPCLDDVAFLTVDGFCAESGNLDVGVSDAKEFKSVVHEHFKAFFRK